MLLLVFESIGTQELALIVIAALVLFGPRKLPELGRMLGKALAEFRGVSDEFKRTWQMEVDLEQAERRRTDDTTIAPSSVTTPEIAVDTAPEMLPAAAGEAAPPFVVKPAASGVPRGTEGAIDSLHDGADHRIGGISDAPAAEDTATGRATLVGASADRA